MSADMEKILIPCSTTSVLKHYLLFEARMTKILIVEDDPDISELVQFILTNNHYEVSVVSSGEVGFSVAQKILPELILLDVMLPGMDGRDVLKRLRATPATASIPVIMLTAKSEESDIIVGLELGADDYVSKPFSVGELLARIKTVLRRRSGELPPILANRLFHGPIAIDEERFEVTVHATPIAVTLTEFKLLAALTRKPGRVYTREQLLANINDSDIYVIDRNIDVHVRSIRRKLGSQL